MTDLDWVILAFFTVPYIIIFSVGGVRYYLLWKEGKELDRER